MVDRPTQSTPTNPTAEDEHNDLLATLAAARELGPDMDKALAESYMQRRKATAPARPRNAEPRPPVNVDFVARAVFPAVMIAACVFAAVLLLPHGWGWFFLLPLFFGGWRRWRGRGWYGYDDRYDRRRAYREERRAAREEWRRARRDDHYDWS